MYHQKDLHFWFYRDIVSGKAIWIRLGRMVSDSLVWHNMECVTATVNTLTSTKSSYTPLKISQCPANRSVNETQSAKWSIQTFWFFDISVIYCDYQLVWIQIQWHYQMFKEDWVNPNTHDEVVKTWSDIRFLILITNSSPTHVLCIIPSLHWNVSHKLFPCFIAIWNIFKVKLSLRDLKTLLKTVSFPYLLCLMMFLHVIQHFWFESLSFVTYFK